MTDKNEWISVNDKLPETGVDVWTTDGVNIDLGFRSMLDTKPDVWIDFLFKVAFWKLLTGTED